MQLPLFKALQSIKINDDQATDVVRSFEEFTALKMTEATAPLAAQLESLKAEISSLKWFIGLLSTVIAVTGVATGVAAAVLHFVK